MTGRSGVGRIPSDQVNLDVVSGPVDIAVQKLLTAFVVEGISHSIYQRGKALRFDLRAF
jgi:hypothetical protein